MTNLDHLEARFYGAFVAMGDATGTNPFAHRIRAIRVCLANPSQREEAESLILGLRSVILRYAQEHEAEIRAEMARRLEGIHTLIQATQEFLGD